MSFPPDLVAMLSAFADAGVRYLVVGGHAVGLHARPRSTKDLDVWLDAAPENIRNACAALARFGVQRELISELRRARADEIVWLGRVPARVDFLQALPGVDFETCWKRRVVALVGGVRATFIGREDLIANKTAVGRPQDRRDVRALERAGALSRGAKAPSAAPRTGRRGSKATGRRKG
ncbi:MAG TPA: DUF6036 family nucleotidyltransferase [Polyangiaceae bacterium]|jgi:hypothetical protein